MPGDVYMTRTGTPDESGYAAAAAAAPPREHDAFIVRSLAPTVYCPARQVERCLGLTPPRDAR